MDPTGLHAAPNQQKVASRSSKSSEAGGADGGVGCVLQSDHLHGAKQQDLAFKDQGQRNEIVARFLFNHCAAPEPRGGLYSQTALVLEILNFTFCSQSTEPDRCVDVCDCSSPMRTRRFLTPRCIAEFEPLLKG